MSNVSKSTPYYFTRKNRARLLLNLPNALKEKIERVSEARGIPASEFIRQAAMSEVSKYEKLIGTNS